MGIDIQTYRCRIGTFTPRKTITKNKSKYNPYSKSSDIHYRVFLSCTLIIFILQCTYCTLWCHKFLQDMDPVMSVHRSTSISNLDHDRMQTGTCYTYNSDSPDDIFQLNTNFNISQYKLMLAVDVESNPGPTEFETLLGAIKQAEDRIFNEIVSVRSDVNEIKNDICSLKTEQIKLRTDFKSIQSRQISIENNIQGIDRSIVSLQDETENIHLDIEHVHNTSQLNSDLLSNISQDVERLNVKSIANNMRIFGLSVPTDINYDGLVKLVIEKVLNIAVPGFKWHYDDIKNVRVISSRAAQNESPLVIVTFRFEDDKFRVFSGRDILRQCSIRVRDDLTFNQRQKLKFLKESEGKSGYFYKGKLCTRSNNSQSDIHFKPTNISDKSASDQPSLNTSSQQHMDVQ
ncbi:hypothetical protein ACF0H5_017770 [Mactra antiquata]